MNLTKGKEYRIIEPGSPNFGRVGKLIMVTKGNRALLKSEELTREELNRIRQYNPSYDRPCDISMVCFAKYLEEV